MGSFLLTPGGDFTKPLLEVRLGVLFLFARLLFRILFKINTLEIEVLAESHGPQDLAGKTDVRIIDIWTIFLG